MLPGGIDVHTHFQMPFGGTVSCETFDTGTKAAATGGTTMVVDFAMQAPGDSLHEDLRRLEGDGRRPRGRRLRASHGRHRPHRRHPRRDPAAGRRRRHQPQALHGLQGRHHGRRRHAPPDPPEGQGVRRTRVRPRRERRRHRRPRQGARGGGQDRPEVPPHHPSSRRRERGDETGHHPRRDRRRPHLHRARQLHESSGRDPRRQGQGPGRVRRDLPSVSRAVRRRLRRPRIRGRQVHLLAAPARQVQLARPVGRAPHRRSLGRRQRPRRVQLRGAEGDGPDATGSTRSPTDAPGSSIDS